MVVAELFVMRQIAGASPIAQRHNQTRTGSVAADARGSLDVLGGVLGLADDEHQPEPLHVDTDLQHRGGQHHVERRLLAGGHLLAFTLSGHSRLEGFGGVIVGVELQPQPVQCAAYLRRRDPCGEFAGVQQAERGPVSGWESGVFAGALDSILNVVTHVAGHARQLAGGVEVSDQRQVRVGGDAAAVQQQLPGGKQHLRDANLGASQTDSLRAYSDVAAAGRCLGDRDFAGEVGVGDVEHLGREDF
ncbi:Uncharacterised protein [Mycobacteroides abscessus subsp. abscessus]|nr:Uncharacterised protein [Mycobacteroides abscessus subsp. abscessus]